MDNRHSDHPDINGKKLYGTQEENDDCIDELKLAEKENAHQKDENKKCAEELAIANAQKDKQAVAISTYTIELTKALEYQREYRESLEQMMLITSHKLRGPVANIIGILPHLNCLNHKPEELEEMKSFLTQSAKSLDEITRELSTLIHDQERKFKSYGYNNPNLKL